MTKRLDMRLDVRDRVNDMVYDDPAAAGYDPAKSGDLCSDTLINRALNQGLAEFVRKERWSWLWQAQLAIPVVAGNGTIELIDDIPVNNHGLLTLTQVGATTNVLLPERVSPAEGLRLKVQHRSTQGEPEFWYTAKTVKNTHEDGDVARANLITLVPTPSVAYTAEYAFIAFPAPMAADIDEPDIPAAYHDALPAWAAAQCFIKELNSGKAQEQLAMFHSILEDARAAEKNLAIDSVPTWGRAASRRRLTSRDFYARHIPGPLG